MTQILPRELKKASRDTLMAAWQMMAQVSPDYLSTIIVQRCEFDEASMESAIPVDAAGAVKSGDDDAGSLGQRGVGLGLGKGRGRP